jgi:hypothetical protein
MIRLPFWDDRRRRRRWLSSLLGRPSLKMGSTLSFFLFLFFTNLFLFFLSFFLKRRKIDNTQKMDYKNQRKIAVVVEFQSDAH